MNIEEILKLIQCPNCVCGKLVSGEKKITCADCQSIFSVVDGVPVLISKKELSNQEKSQKKWFENHYAAFSDSEYNLEKWRQSMLNRVFENEFKSQVKYYLDVGCGATGYTVIEGARRNGWISFGTDISLEAMVRAKKLATKEGVGDKTAFIVCSAENIPLKKGTFDYISSISVLEHLENDWQAARELSRVLKEIGFIYVCVPNAYFRIWPFLWPFYYYKDRKIGHKRHYSVEKMDQMFTEKHSFRRHKLFYNGHLIKFIQILLEKLGRISDKKWWQIEKRDISKNSSGVQLNVIYSREKNIR